MQGVAQAALTPANWPTFVFVATRVGGLLMAAPLWSMKGLPARARAALTVVLAAALLPAVAPARVADSILLIPLGLATEFLIGLAVGLTAAVIVYGVALGGEVLAHQMGLSLGAEASGLSEVSVPGIGQLKTYLALMIYVAVDGHLMLLRGLADSFASMPPGSPVSLEAAPAFGASLLATTFTCAVQAAAPALVALLLVDLAIGFTSRAVPQLQAILVLFPVSIGVGLLMLGVSLPMISSTLTRWMMSLPEAVAAAVQAFRAVP